MLAFALVAFVGSLSVHADASTPCTMAQKVNAYRAAFGLPPFYLDGRLNAVAQAHSDDMAKNCGMQHESCNGQSWGSRVAAYFPSWTVLSENVGSDTLVEDLILGAFQRSAAHNANLLGAQTTSVGYGFSNGFWTQDFASESPEFPSNRVTCPAIPTAQQAWVGRIKTKPEGLCLDAGNGKGFALRARTCDSTSKSQLFTLVPANGKGTFLLYASLLDLCADVFSSRTTPGATLGAWPCNWKANQQFTVSADGAIVPAHAPSQCVELASNKVHPSNTMVTLWNCNGGANQKWVKSVSG
ncbi:ricin B lectin domain-containing protein [Zopfochytrium polystomum]|nr:ricin B lectin domain-containing protein [Zopfochytrium polystomum]